MNIVSILRRKTSLKSSKLLKYMSHERPSGNLLVYSGNVLIVEAYVNGIREILQLATGTSMT